MNFSKAFLSVVVICLSFITSSAQQSWNDYIYYDTFQMSNNTFFSPHTVFSDISDSGVIVGYFRDTDNSYTGLVYFKNGKTITYKYAGYTHTEILGVNGAGVILGRAYSSPSSAIAFMADIVGEKIHSATEVDWNGSGANYKWPTKLNENGIGSGSVQSSTQRWLHYEQIDNSTTIDKTVRYKKQTTTYNTYGQGINDNLLAVGYYLDGSRRVPFVYSDGDNRFDVCDHVVDYGLQGTIFNDINNDDFIALEYKDSFGFWHGTIGKYSSTTKNVVYANNFPMKGSRGSSIKGINNNGDIVGTYTLDNNETYAFFATTTGMRIKDFDITKHAFKWGNYSSIFETDTLRNNYRTGDPYKSDTNSIYKKAKKHLGINAVTEKALLYGTQSPSWTSYVLAQGESNCYINGRYRLNEVGKWLNLTTDSFGGFCSGISFITGQHFTDTNRVNTRFPLIPQVSTLNDYNATKFSMDVEEMLGAVQLYQFSNHLSHIQQGWSDQIDNFENQHDAVNYALIKQYTKELAQDFYDVQAKDSLNVLGIYLTFDVTQPLGGHDVFPIEVSRPFDRSLDVDTITIMDPNFPQQEVHLVVKYDVPRIDAYNLFGSHLYFVATASLSGNLGEVDITKNAQLAAQRPAVVKQNHQKANQNPSTIFTRGLCDYKIENLDKPSEIIELVDDKFTNGIPSVYIQQIFNSDHLPDVLTSTQNLNIKSTISGCTDVHSWHFAHKDGSFIYARTGVKPSEQDVIYNNGKTMRIVNSNNSLENVQVTSIMESDDEEAVVSLSNFKLENGKEITVEVIDMYRVEVKNDKTDSASYTLDVRYLANNDDFEWVTTGIKINSDDTHTILLKPTDTDKEVRILVDTTGDGNADDTLIIQNNSGIEDVLMARYHLQLFPNPAGNIINLSMENLQSHTSTFVLMDVHGKVVYSEEVSHGSSFTKQFDVSHLARGVYTAEIKTHQGRSTMIKKVVLK